MLTCGPSLTKQGKITLKEEQDSGIDVDGSIFVSKSLLLKLGLFNHEWVVCSAVGLYTDKAKTAGRGEAAQSPGRIDDRAACKDAGKSRGCAHLASVVVSDFVKSSEVDLQENVGYVSPVLWFNLSNGDPVPVVSRVVKIKRRNEPLPSAETQLSESRSRTASLPFAKELHIETVISPLCSSHGVYDSILSDHFSTPRLVQQKDVICIPTEGRAEFLDSNTEGFSSLSPPGLSNTVEQLTSILLPHMNGSSAALVGVCSVLLSGPSGGGKVTALRAACRRLHLHLLKVDCVTLCADTPAACEARMQAAFSRAELHRPCVLLLRNLQLLGLQQGGASQDPRVLSSLCLHIAGAPSRVVVVGSVCNPRQLSPDVVAAFVHQVAVESPTEDQRRGMLISLSGGLTVGKDVNLGRVAKQSAGFVLGDLCTLLTLAGKAAHRRLLESCEDFASALEQLQETHSQAIGAPKIPQVRWQDVGGLQQVKKEILDTIQLPLEHPELLGLGLRRSGLLLYGPPGTGKTLLAKAVATECAMTFLSVKGPELINMYVGQSEENVRDGKC
ncbi:hypothetical protein JZ751_027602 [Albula glossodonta]|uniref:ATPase AAA-type core domain-containing protein n=1 Tax=Albula glossodonta TaxID=121402 RepID=A0A8T2NER0_9TELE|nr:hypothetical protein JZ751_027602 [Albula glossodonta]